MVDIDAAVAFVATHGRVLERRRMELALGGSDRDGVLAALAGYANADGGYGWALEPDLRASGSQPVTALHAFEVFEEVAPATSPAAARLCDWLESITLPNGQLPFALAGADAPGSAPFWAATDPAAPSLHATAMLAAIAHRVARHDSAVAAHPWLVTATAAALDAIAALEQPSGAYELRFVLDLLDTVHDSHPQAPAQLTRLAALLPATGRMPVAGGAEDEALRALDFSPRPHGALRPLLEADAVETELERLADRQDEDGGWHVDFRSWSPAGALEWRGIATVQAIRLLIANGRVTP